MARVIVLACLLFCIGPTAADDVTKQEIAKLEGTWMVVEGQADGKPLVADAIPRTIEFRGNQAIGFGPEMTFTIDPSKKPKHLTLTAKLPEKGKADKVVVTHAIYRLEKDELTLGIPLVKEGSGSDNRRPESFETVDKPIVVLVLRRGKIEKK